MRARQRMVIVVCTSCLAATTAFLARGLQRETTALAQQDPAKPVEAFEGPEENAVLLATVDVPDRAPVIEPTRESRGAKARCADGAFRVEVTAPPQRVEQRTQLRVRAIDASSGLPIHKLRVRAVSPTRLADRDSGESTAEMSLRLTPDTYAVFVSSTGYEPVELPPVRVACGETTDLGTVALRPGEARVAGIVHGARGARCAQYVELVGVGRRPCEECSAEPVPSSSSEGREVRNRWLRNDPCPSCGFSEASTRVAVAPDETFAFQHLASGPYALLLTDVEGRAIGLPKAVVLDAEEWKQVELDSADLRTLRVELVDTDGRSTASDWAECVASQGGADGEDREVRFVPSIEWRCSFRIGAVCAATSELCTPARAGCMPIKGCTGARCCGVGYGSRLDDRPRPSGEELRPAVRAPVIAPPLLSCEVDSEGLACFEGLTSCPLSVEMSCGAFTAIVEAPASSDTTRVRARIVRAPPSASTAVPATTASTFRAFEAERYR